MTVAYQDERLSQRGDENPKMWQLSPHFENAFPILNEAF